MRTLPLFLALSIPALAVAQAPEHLAPVVAKYVKYDNSKNTLWLDHVRVIDGTGAPPIEDATVILSAGKIAAILTPNHMQANEGHMSTWSCTDCPPALRRELTGHTIFPGLVGMHDRMYYITRPNL